MNDALGVRLLEAGDDLDGDRQGLLDRHRPPDQALRERLALDALEDQVGRPVQLLEAVDGGNVGVAEGGQDPRLALEAAQAGRVTAERVGQPLDRHLTTQRGVERAVDAAHAAGAQQVEDLIAPDVLTEGEVVARRLLTDRVAAARVAARVARVGSGRCEIRRFRGGRQLTGVALSLPEHLPQLLAQADVAGGALVDPAFPILRRQLEHGAQQRRQTLGVGSRPVAALLVAHVDVRSSRREALLADMIDALVYYRHCGRPGRLPRPGHGCTMMRSTEWTT